MLPERRLNVAFGREKDGGCATANWLGTALPSAPGLCECPLTDDSLTALLSALSSHSSALRSALSSIDITGSAAVPKVEDFHRRSSGAAVS